MLEGYGSQIEKGLIPIRMALTMEIKDIEFSLIFPLLKDLGGGSGR
jgi:hypothetical protein